MQLPQGLPTKSSVSCWLVATFPHPHPSHLQFTKPSPDALNPSFIAHSSVVLQKSQSLRNFSEKVKKDTAEYPGSEHSVCGASLHLTRAGEPPCCHAHMALSSQAIRTETHSTAHSQELQRQGQWVILADVGLSVPVLSDYSLGWQQGYPQA